MCWHLIYTSHLLLLSQIKWSLVRCESVFRIEKIKKAALHSNVKGEKEKLQLSAESQTKSVYYAAKFKFSFTSHCREWEWNKLSTAWQQLCVKTADLNLWHPRDPADCSKARRLRWLIRCQVSSWSWFVRHFGPILQFVRDLFNTSSQAHLERKHIQTQQEG